MSVLLIYENYQLILGAYACYKTASTCYEKYQQLNLLKDMIVGTKQFFTRKTKDFDIEYPELILIDIVKNDPPCIIERSLSDDYISFDHLQ
jgi:hypothetical protein